MPSSSNRTKAAAVSTRSATEIWLVGQPLSSIDEIEPSQLPVSGVVLRRIYSEMKTNKATLAAACSTVADEVMSYWEKANISTIAKPHVAAKLKSLHQDHVTVSKNKHRRSSASQLTPIVDTLRRTLAKQHKHLMPNPNEIGSRYFYMLAKIHNKT